MMSTLYLVLLSMTLVHAGEFIAEGCCTNDMKTKFTSILMDYNSRLNRIMLNVSNVLAENEGTRSSPPTYKDCRDAFDQGNTVSKIYTFNIGGNLVQGYCDMETDGGGWMVFQRRMDGSENFFRRWTDYAKGFGSPRGEYWLGNDNLHQLSLQPSELRVDLETFDDTNVYAKYSRFSVGDATTKYQLRIAGYSGTAGDSMTIHNNSRFSTFDQDNDRYEASCAERFDGAWWYIACHASNLNGQYLWGKTTTYANGVVWKTFKGYYYSLKTSTMMIRRINNDS